jgi:type I restriction enzyme R subunit
MRQGKLADIEALKQMKLISDDVVNKKDKSLPEEVESQKGSDVFYRNLRAELGDLNLSEDVYIAIILDIFTIIKNEAIVDWHKNLDVKRKMRNSIDDYLYDVVKGKKGIDIDGARMKSLIDRSIQLAENNVIS